MERQALLKEIKRLMYSKGLTPYAVAKNAHMRGSSIYTALDDSDAKMNCPQIETLEQICDGMGITLSRLFEFASKDDKVAYLSEDGWKLINMYRRLSKDNANSFMIYSQGVLDFIEKNEQKAKTED